MGTYGDPEIFSIKQRIFFASQFRKTLDSSPSKFSSSRPNMHYAVGCWHTQVPLPWPKSLDEVSLLSGEKIDTQTLDLMSSFTSSAAIMTTEDDVIPSLHASKLGVDIYDLMWPSERDYVIQGETERGIFLYGQPFRF